MNQQEFNKLVEETTFDESIKRLFHTSYDLGFAEGQIKAMQRAVNILDSIEFEKAKQ